MKSTDLLQLVDNLQQAGKINNLQQVCRISGCVYYVEWDLSWLVVRRATVYKQEGHTDVKFCQWSGNNSAVTADCASAHSTR